MKRKERALFIEKKLNELYPNPKAPLDHKNAFTFLVAVLLSAQTTDKRVNLVTKELFKLADNPQKMLDLGEKQVYELIKTCGLAPKKAKAIISTSKIILEKHQGKVPDELSLLEELPGVGHKTASVVISEFFDKPAFPVDTHIHRLAQRWGLTNGQSVKKTEKDLKLIFDETSWRNLHLQFIFYGRAYCSARGCDGTICFMCKSLYPNRKTKIKTTKA
ncbi:MAG: endonuclease III [Euryarchaeota archaeon]|nr:endonuclease III [Euryarchaeota archaeon]|tara:strand:- start:1575 stop:2228 length:654 start_codon:yes stop_codon:yes gene_type:complete